MFRNASRLSSSSLVSQVCFAIISLNWEIRVPKSDTAVRNTKIQKIWHYKTDNQGQNQAIRRNVNGNLLEPKATKQHRSKNCTGNVMTSSCKFIAEISPEVQDNRIIFVKISSKIVESEYCILRTVSSSNKRRTDDIHMREQMNYRPSVLLILNCNG